MNHIPVTGRYYRHFLNGKVFIELVESCRSTGSSGRNDCGSGLHIKSLISIASKFRVKQAIHKCRHVAGSSGIMYRTAEDEAVCFISFFPETVYHIIKNAFSCLYTSLAGNAAANRFIANPENLCFNPFFLQGIGHLAKRRISAALLMGTAIYQKNLHH